MTVSALVFIVLMHSKNKKDCLKTVLFYSHLQNVPHMWYLLIPRCSFLYHICGTFLSTTEKCILYHICGIFLIPQEGKKPPLDVPCPENMVSPDGGERSAAVPCFSLYVNQSSCCMNTGFHWGGNIQSSEFTHIFFMGIFANEKGTGFDARSFFERLYQCQKLYNSLMDNKKYDSLLFKLKASPILQNLLITFLGRTSFSVCSSTSCRS